MEYQLGRISTYAGAACRVDKTYYDRSVLTMRAVYGDKTVTRIVFACRNQCEGIYAGRDSNARRCVARRKNQSSRRGDDLERGVIGNMEHKCRRVSHAHSGWAGDADHMRSVAVDP